MMLRGLKALRLAVRIVRILLVVAGGLALAGAFAACERLGLDHSMQRQQRWSQVFMRQLCRALPLRVTVQGQVPNQPMLWVSNHVSWTDIPLIGMLAPLSFLSKAQVREWPLAGWLAVMAGTLFIRRGASDSQRLRRQMALQLSVDASPLVIFPEGTTSDGQGLRTFHGRLLASATDAGVALQPVAIRYSRHGAADMLAPFIGDDDLLSHLLRLLREDCAEVEVQLLAPINTQGVAQLTLAHQVQEAVWRALLAETPRMPDAKSQAA